jgi:hypothetical protein
LHRYFSKNILGIRLLLDCKYRKFLKKYLNINDPVKALSERVQPLKLSVVTGFKKPASAGISRFRKFIFIVFLLIMSFRVAAPEANSFIIYEYPHIRAFTDLMYATAMVETMGNPLAYNEFENAVGIFQIRQVRIDEYNQRTGSNLALSEMYDPQLSEKVFLYFATRYGPYNLEKIAKSWNGSGPMTELYWKRIKEYL